MKTKIKIILAVAVLAVIAPSCEGFLDTETTGTATKEQIDELGKTNPDAIKTIAYGTIQGVYGYMDQYGGNHDVFGHMSVGLAGDLMTEDINQNVHHWFGFDYNIDNRQATYRRVIRTWEYAYTVISKSNEIIGSVNPEVTDPDLKAYLGQALALRAMGLHIAVQRFQQTYKGNENAPGVPIYLTANDDEPTSQGRGTVQKVYDRIIKDLERAIVLLDGYNRPAKTMVNKQVAAGLLARVYMTTNDWVKAQQMANMARQGYSLMTIAEARVDRYNSLLNKEWMWGALVTPETTNMFASYQSHISSTAPGYAGAAGVYKSIDAKLYSQISDNDLRKGYFSDGVTPAAEDGKLYPKFANLKFGNAAGWLNHNPYMRVAEMYLIEAEALARQGKGGEAATVLNALLQNRISNFTPYGTVTAEQVFFHKRLECWGEGVIFYDYLRMKLPVNRNYDNTNHRTRINVPAGDWRFIYQLPQSEIDNNSEITQEEQNP